MSAYKRTDIWKHFCKKETDDKKRATIATSLDYAGQELSNIRDTFPTYTLHDEDHAINVLKRATNLLGDKLDQLTSLESAIILLSAYFHDIGMVFKEEERRNIATQPRFEDFLQENPGARLMIQEHRDEHDDEAMIPESVTEWFCRWSHHERVHIYLKNRNISWGTVDIGDMVGLVCESHGQDVKELLNPKFSTDYLAEADLRFCALILRLADILDFDNTRSPDAIYRYLGLSKINRPDSNEEWQKHYASDGFRFPATDKCQDNYELPFIAGPDDPSVEYDIRTFLDTIENEIQKTRKILQSCDPKWQDIALPGKIKRNNIRSKHYDYAEYRFTLEQDFVDG
ncbi:MAG: hypothetical protein AAFR67_01305 [Chloroflexota bacterium]